MRKLILLVLFLFVIPWLEAYASPQIPDILIYKGKEYPIHVGFLEDYFKRFPDRNPKDDEFTCSALWRGYHATFQVINGKIYLKNIFTNVCFGPPTSHIKKVVPGGGRLSVDWVSGLIQAGYGENHEDPYDMESVDAYEKYSFFEVENGRVLEVRHFDNKGYRAFKKRQFGAFRKTGEYEPSVTRMLADSPRMTRKDVEWNIQRSIFTYTKRFLVADGKRRLKEPIRR